MYDTDEEIKKKRRNLIIIIGVVVFLIILFILILLTHNSGSGENENISTELNCTIGVQDGINPDSSGIYHQPLTIEFKNIVAVSKKYDIVKKTIGTGDRSTNKETLTLTNSGTYHVNGYVQDSAGHRGKCELSLQIALSVPSCELEVTKGTLGDNGWYRSDVEVGFKSMSANNPSISISRYYIDKEDSTSQSTGNVEKYSVTDNNKTSIVGHVIDSTGNEGTCKLEVNKDSTVPTCKLKVISGTDNGNGVYTDIPEIGFESFSDDVSEIASKGVGISKNYEHETYKVTGAGKTTVVGYVKDKAGNEGSCMLEITRPGSSGGGASSKPTCSITLSPAGNNGVYTQDVTATLKYSTSNGAAISSFGIAESETYNQKTSIKITKTGSHKVYGIVKDSYGNVGKCSSSFTIKKGELLVNKVSVGDYVGYDAGKWDTTRTAKETDGYYWGMKSGTSKQTGVKCDSSDTGTRNGWIVLAKYNGHVLLISAGTPECIYHGRTSTSTLINVMQSEAKKYVNTKYADGWTALSCDTPGFDCNKKTYSGNVFVTTNSYWIVQNGSEYGLGAITTSGKKEFLTLRSRGLRPVIQLRADVKTTGKNGKTWVLQ